MKKNPFKEIVPEKNVPPEVKEKVMSELATISLANEIAGHFTIKFGAVISELFTLNKKRK